MLTEEENFAGLARINRDLISRVEALDSAQRAVLDMGLNGGKLGEQRDRGRTGV